MEINNNGGLFWFGCRVTIPRGCSHWCINPLLLWRFSYSHSTRRESTRAYEFSLDTRSFLYSCYSSPLWVWPTKISKTSQNILDTHKTPWFWTSQTIQDTWLKSCICSVTSTTKPHNMTSQAIQDIRYHFVLFRYHKNPMIWTWSMSLLWEFPLDR